MTQKKDVAGLTLYPAPKPVYTRESVLTKAELAQALSTSERQVERAHFPVSYALGPQSPRYVWGAILDTLAGEKGAA